MWELIRANHRRSIILFVGLAICLMSLGFFIGAVLFPPDGGVAGLFVAIFIWLVMSVVSLTAGESIFLSISRAKPVTHDVHPQLFNVTEEMKIAANLPAMPRLYIMHERAPNAFAAGVNAEKSAIVITTGLLEKLNRDELQGVVAHEMSHILNRDVQFVTMAGILLGSITLFSEVFLRGMYYSSRSSRRYSSGRSSSGGGQAQAVIVIVAIVFAILAPILARILYFAISRKREYLADATAARLTRYPEGLASALEKISSSKEDLSVANKVMAPMYIANPLKRKGVRLSNLTSTHPPLDERVRVLRSIAGGVNFSNYQQAYGKIKGTAERIIPQSGLADKEQLSIRQPSSEVAAPKTKKSELRNINDLARALNGFAFISCVCGLNVKVPPDFKKSQINCPRCNKVVDVPLEEIVAAGAAIKTVMDATGQQIFKRKKSGWESAQCSCGKLVQISPAFSGTNMACPRCKKTIKIEK